jgi:hypothetical protein
MARITISDLAPVQTLTPEELVQIFGAGRRTFRPTLEGVPLPIILAA